MKTLSLAALSLLAVYPHSSARAREDFNACAADARASQVVRSLDLQMKISKGKREALEQLLEDLRPNRSTASRGAIAATASGTIGGISGATALPFVAMSSTNGLAAAGSSLSMAARLNPAIRDRAIAGPMKALGQGLFNVFGELNGIKYAVLTSTFGVPASVAATPLVTLGLKAESHSHFTGFSHESESLLRSLPTGDLYTLQQPAAVQADLASFGKSEQKLIQLEKKHFSELDQRDRWYSLGWDAVRGIDAKIASAEARVRLYEKQEDYAQRAILVLAQQCADNLAQQHSASVATQLGAKSLAVSQKALHSGSSQTTQAASASGSAQ